MPRVFAGLFRSMLALAVLFALAAGTSIAVYWISYATDALDSVSMQVSGLPAKDTSVSRAVNPVLRGLAYVGALVPVGILLVYFVYRPRR